MIRWGIPAMCLKEFDYNALRNLSIPLRLPLLLPPIKGADVDWYIKADDIVLTKDSSSFSQPQAKKELTQDK